MIGNGDYQNAGILKNPANDANGVSQTLQTDGYKVRKVLNGEVEDALTELKDFSLRASEASLSVFFFAGHGIEVDGKNYLLPVDARLDIEEGLTGSALQVALERETIPLD